MTIHVPLVKHIERRCRLYNKEEKRHDKAYKKENSKHEKRHIVEIKEAFKASCDKKKKKKK